MNPVTTWVPRLSHARAAPAASSRIPTERLRATATRCVELDGFATAMTCMAGIVGHARARRAWVDPATRGQERVRRTGADRPGPHRTAPPSGASAHRPTAVPPGRGPQYHS